MYFETGICREEHAAQPTQQKCTTEYNNNSYVQLCAKIVKLEKPTKKLKPTNKKRKHD